MLNSFILSCSVCYKYAIKRSLSTIFVLILWDLTYRYGDGALAWNEVLFLHGCRYVILLALWCLLQHFYQSTLCNSYMCSRLVDIKHKYLRRSASSLGSLCLWESSLIPSSTFGFFYTPDYRRLFKEGLLLFGTCNEGFHVVWQWGSLYHWERIVAVGMMDRVVHSRWWNKSV